VRFQPRAIPCAWAFQNLGGWSDDHTQYPVEVLNRAADIFRMAGHMLGKRLPDAAPPLSSKETEFTAISQEAA
jgi:hypothetical protein